MPPAEVTQSMRSPRVPLSAEWSAIRGDFGRAFGTTKLAGEQNTSTMRSGKQPLGSLSLPRVKTYIELDLLGANTR